MKNMTKPFTASDVILRNEEYWARQEKCFKSIYLGVPDTDVTMPIKRALLSMIKNVGSYPAQTK